MPSILITGASTGIGRATATHLAARGFKVFSGVRALVDAPPRTTPVLLDVTNGDHIARAAALLSAEDLLGVVNNAGQNYISPFEYTDEAMARRTMEINFFGLYRLSQAFIPHLRRFAEAHPDQTAKLINVSSIGGLLGLPWETFYHASKFAVTGLTQGLQAELWSQNIRAVLVCPGGIRTEFMPKTKQGIDAAIAAHPGAPQAYSAGLKKFAGLVPRVDNFGLQPSRVAVKIGSILAKKHPSLRQLVGMDARLLFCLSRWLPQTVFNGMLRAMFTS